jgi:hypothetical protein
MQGDSHGTTKVSVQGAATAAYDAAALAALCAAVGRAVQAHRPEGLLIREVVVTLEGVVPAFGSSEAAPVYVDVYDSGYGHGI